MEACAAGSLDFIPESYKRSIPMWPAPRPPTPAERARLVSGHLPALATCAFEVSAPATHPALIGQFVAPYNCLGWVIDQEYPFHYWPPDDARFAGQSPMSIMDAYFSHRGMPRAAVLPPNPAKAIALYARSADDPTHVALLRSDGRWESKLGQDVRIIHPHLTDLDGPAYGSVAGYYL
jgi:hypothetical protein